MQSRPPGPGLRIACPTSLSEDGGVLRCGNPRRTAGCRCRRAGASAAPSPYSRPSPRPPSDEMGIGRAVIGAAALVLLRPAAEFRIGHHQGRVPAADFHQRRAQRGEPFGQLLSRLAGCPSWFAWVSKPFSVRRIAAMPAVFAASCAAVLHGIAEGAAGTRSRMATWRSSLLAACVDFALDPEDMRERRVAAAAAVGRRQPRVAQELLGLASAMARAPCPASGPMSPEPTTTPSAANCRGAGAARRPARASPSSSTRRFSTPCPRSRSSGNARDWRSGSPRPARPPARGLPQRHQRLQRRMQPGVRRVAAPGRARSRGAGAAPHSAGSA